MLKMTDCMGLGKRYRGTAPKPQERIGNGGWGQKSEEMDGQPFGGIIYGIGDFWIGLRVSLTPKNLAWATMEDETVTWERERC